jgi:hypothetical protein
VRGWVGRGVCVCVCVCVVGRGEGGVVSCYNFFCIKHIYNVVVDILDGSRMFVSW